MRKKIIIIAGPTGVGKTEVSIDLAKKNNCEIISCDSMQIYKHLDIGTAKISESEKQGVIHHMIDIINPDDDYSVAEYASNALKVVEDMFNRNIIPMFVGGTGLYIDSILFTADYSNTEPNYELRKKLEAKYAEDNGVALYNYLSEIDIKTAEKLCPSDKNRIIRAIEIYEQTGIPKSSQKKSKRNYIGNYEFDVYMFVLGMDRKLLYDRINSRVDKMIENGLLQEVKHLINSGYNINSQAFQAIGYREVINYMNSIMSYDDMLCKIKQYSRNYAKRQLTWFRKNPDYIWIDKTNMNNAEVVDEIQRYL